MTLFDNYSREQLRRAYSEAWAKHLQHLPMTRLETEITDVIGAHPEYQDVVADADAALAYGQALRANGQRAQALTPP